MSDIGLAQIIWALVWALILGSTGFALWKGGPAERAGAVLILCFAVLYELMQLLPRELRPTAQLVGDGLTAFGLLLIAVRYASLWLGSVLLFQAAQFTLHSYYLVSDRPHDALHAVINNVNLVGILACLVAGTLAAIQRRAAHQGEAQVSAAAAPGS